jgi:hypothetical protein
MKYIQRYWTYIIIVFIISFFIKSALSILLASLLGLYILAETIFILKNIRNEGIECYGKIVKYNTDSDGDKTPVVEFTTKKGETIKEEPLTYSSINIVEIFSRSKEINKPVLIKYNPEDPKYFILVNENNYFAMFIGLLVILTFVVVSTLGLLGYINMD